MQTSTCIPSFLENIKGAIFDLDGVIVDTAKYHYLAWRRLAEELRFEFTEADNERLKGVSRVRSLEILLEIGQMDIGDALKQEMLRLKNEWYLEYIYKMPKEEILPGAREYIEMLKANGAKVALGSASKNAPLILERLEITDLFDSVVDGNSVSEAKPAPDVFLKGAQSLSLAPEDCVVFEDAEAGIEAAHRAKMKAVGIGSKALLPEADYNISGLDQLIEKP
ncbi:beta-phosphoglucomutase [Coraliomargarita parva]|uniref:beta-phosphoglucomutase n=1 Tax=Coraliomargarita parva TaxID=3014050 RepID=UPI0022B5B291|nr:beta-phosphoglucomutase [Coraliomargarita parva]